MKVSFLIHTIYGIGGTIRTTLNLAEELAGRHDVEIVSVFRHRDEPLFAIDPRISVVPLIDTRPSSPGNEKKHPLALQPAERFPAHEARFAEYSRLTDQRVREHYTGSDADVVIGTRPGLVAYVAQFAPERAVLIGQEHMTHNHHKPELRAEMREHLAALDVFVTVSEGDAVVWRDRMPLPDTQVLAIPNSVPEPMVATSDLGGTTVVAAGRLASEKQYDVLIEAFAKVVAVRPDWTLRICGWGKQKERLRRRIDQLGLYNRVHLMGPRSPIEPEWVKGAIAVSTSRHESFGMTLVEAMRCGLPVVSTDCDYGPREIIADGVDGLLVPVGDTDAIAAALLRLIDDEPLRRRMGAAARSHARRFDPGPVAKQYEELFAALGAGSRSHTEGPPVPSATPSAGSGHESVSAPAPAPAFAPVPSPAAGDPRVDCVAEESGALTVTLLGEQTGETVLVCAHPDPAAPDRVFPFDASGRATVPADADLAEGIWTCHAVPQGYDGERPPLATRAVDQRGAMRAAARVRPGVPVRALVPYVRQGGLTLRSWVRPVHAESGDVNITARHLTISGRLLGEAQLTADPVLLLRRRGKDTGALEFPGARVGADGFRCTVPLAAPAKVQASAHDVWDLWLRPAAGAEPVRIGRFLDDVVEKGTVFPYPSVDLLKKRPFAQVRATVRRLRSRPRDEVTVKIFFSAGNELVLNVVDKAMK
ncbi:glycosyltransferase family 4 protein [Streptomyces sp. NBC_01619]|uniref:Glycosyltransferase family 4 protein n=1 Tax=Streptomyces pratisoli TaxID=3139917 RepID=A0ACC6QFV2_9ACTN|nr:glycosyltransferase family 4 protein [Streptomyces sp. NBC_01619]MCX4509104.1 glycosyltransferase family 4 protein [Streptomyces sp. NBC_01619]